MASSYRKVCSLGQRLGKETAKADNKLTQLWLVSWSKFSPVSSWVRAFRMVARTQRATASGLESASATLLLYSKSRMSGFENLNSPLLDDVRTKNIPKRESALKVAAQWHHQRWAPYHLKFKGFYLINLFNSEGMKYFIICVSPCHLIIGDHKATVVLVSFEFESCRFSRFRFYRAEAPNDKLVLAQDLPEIKCIQDICPVLHMELSKSQRFK